MGLPDDVASSYDVVFCSHILEHIAYPDKLLADIKNKLISDDSMLLVALPNFMNYKNRMKMLMGKFEYEKDGTMDYTHLRWYTFKTGKELLEKNNFTILISQVEGFLPLNSVLKYLPVVVKDVIVKSLLFFSKGLFGSQLIFIAMKR